jgi:hypothetical protein
VPLLAVRSALNGEHVDEHQNHFAQEILRRGLGRVLELSGSDNGVLEEVARLEPHKPADKRAATALPPMPVLVRGGQLRSFRSRGPGQPKRAATPAPPHHAVSVDSGVAGTSTPVSGNEP